MKKLIIIFSSLFIAIDQIIKVIINNNLEIYKSIKVIPNFFYITFIKNDGAAFGMLSGGRWFFIILTLVVLILFIKLIVSSNNITKFDIAAYSIIIGGTVGNFLDRIIYGYVIDYLDFYILKYDAPIFNFADMGIVIGAFMLIYIMLFRGGLSENNNSI